MKKFLMIFLATFALLAFTPTQVMADQDDLKKQLADAISGGGQKPSTPAAAPAGTKRSGGGGGGGARVSNEKLDELLARLEAVERANALESISAAQEAARDIVVWYFVLVCIFGALSVICCILTLLRLPITPKLTVLARRIKALEDRLAPPS